MSEIKLRDIANTEANRRSLKYFVLVAREVCRKEGSAKVAGEHMLKAAAGSHGMTPLQFDEVLRLSMSADNTHQRRLEGLLRGFRSEAGVGRRERT